MGKAGYFSCASLSIISEVWAPPHGILSVISLDVDLLKEADVPLCLTENTSTTNDRYDRTSVMTQTDGQAILMLMSREREQRVDTIRNRRRIVQLKDHLGRHCIVSCWSRFEADGSSQARVKSGLASFSLITIGCSILSESMPSSEKVQSSAHS